jgi:hypothetical protein
MYKTFLETVLPSEGTYVITAINAKNKKDVRQKYAESLEDAYQLIENFKKVQEPPLNIYFALSTFEGFSRKAADSIYIKSFFLDLDVGKENNSYATKEEAFAGLAQFIQTAGLPEPTIIDSGNGLHVYWILKEELETHKWKPYAEAFKKLCVDNNLIIDPAVPADMARVLRVPYTLNFNVKAGQEPIEVELVNDIKLYDLSELTPFIGEVAQETAFDLSQVKKGLDDETRKMLGLDNYEFVFEKIAVESLEGRGCNQIKWILENATSCPEPLWKAGLSVAIRCVDGDTAIHTMSEDHPEYSASETEKKARDCLQASWAYSCKAFENENPGGCDGCPFRGNIPSPTHIGKRLRIAQPGADDAHVPDTGTTETGDSSGAENKTNGLVQNKFPKEYLTFPQFLYPYVRPVQGGVWYETPPEQKKDGTVISKDPIMILNQDFVPIKRLYSPNDGECMHMRLFLPHDGVREFILPMTVVYAPEKFKEFVAKSGVLVSVYLIDKLRDYLVKWSQYLKQYQKADDMRMAMGWTDEPKFGSFVAGKVEINSTGRFDCPVTPAARNVADKIHEQGSFDTWQQSANMMGRKGFEYHALGLFIGFGSPLIPFTHTTGLMFSFSGKRGTGKTGALHAGLSVFGDPMKQKITTLDGATMNGLWNRSSTLNNLMMGLDETSNAPPAKISDVIYKGPMNNQGKIREQSSYNVERKQREGSMNMTLMTTNQSNRDKMYMVKGDPGGELRRLLEFDISETGKIEETLGNQMFQPLNSNFGHAGPFFIEYCYKLGIPEVDKIVKTWNTRLQQEFHNDSAYSFWNGGVAACMAGAEIAERAGIVSIDYEHVYKFILERLHKLHDEYASGGVNYEDLLNEFLSVNLNGILAFNESDKVSVEPRGKDLVARAEVNEGKVWISKSAIKDYLHEKQINVAQFETDLMKKNIMLNNKCKKKMASGWKSAMGAMNLWCYEIKLDVSDVINEQETGPTS